LFHGPPVCLTHNFYKINYIDFWIWKASIEFFYFF
jgi:hypothetical protein